MSNINANKTIAMNTAFLYIKMVVTMLISLYTSRILLQTLGVSDFGIYGLVGGIVTMFASLKTMFTVATQRFLNIELGRKNFEELNKVFNVSILVNIVIIVFFVFVVEMVGLWLLQNKLQISPDRMNAAIWVFQLSVAASIVSIINIPFDADIIAREKMNVFAFVAIYDAIAKLGIVFLLPFLGEDRLIHYAILMLMVIFSDFIINVLYCRIKFLESRLRLYPFIDVKSKFLEMFSFSGWAFFGNFVFTLVNEGINVLLNMFGGVIANAARTITYQVRGALSNLVSNVYVAVKPQSIQSYASQDMERFYKLMFTGGKVVGYMYILLAIPLFFVLNEILSLWLGAVPEYAVSFICASLIYQYIRVLHESVGSFFVTIGKLKKYQIIELIALGSALPLSYIGLKFFDMPLYAVFLVMAFSELLNLVLLVILARKIGNFDAYRYVTDVLFPYGIMTILCFISVYLIKIATGFIPVNSIIKTFLFLTLSIMVEISWLYLKGLQKEEKALFSKILKH